MNVFAFLIAIASATPIFAQSFSCNMGGQPNCLNYGDTVCSSQGMCVGKDAACFDKYQCDYDGFTCKSNVTECVRANDELLNKNNGLIDEYNLLLKKSKALAAEHDQLLINFGNVTTERDNFEVELSDAKACMQRVSTLDEAASCLD